MAPRIPVLCTPVAMKSRIATVQGLQHHAVIKFTGKQANDADPSSSPNEIQEFNLSIQKTVKDNPTEADADSGAYESVQLRIHPRVFAALGKDLVTNDVVAVIELVKNSYDAFAQNVFVKFEYDETEGQYLEILDDGTGMSKEVVENEWCVVGTPYKKKNSVVRKDGKTRQVTGNKGLGRLSVARLGNRLVMLTKTSKSPRWEVKVNWSEISEATDLSQSSVELREYQGDSPFAGSGTRLRILDLVEEWDASRISELQDNLSRLVSPFATPGDFNIYLSAAGSTEQVRIEPPQFLSEPKYCIKGAVDGTGNLKATYRFSPIRGDFAPKTKNVNAQWSQIHQLAKEHWRLSHSEEGANCGPFSFDIRAWDIDSDGSEEISDKYNVARNSVRRAIRAHKGISVYRDDVLVLPKSERGLDWLGLDLRRVSQIGRRLSTSQIVGYVSISAKSNPKIEDTSDRERLSLSPEVEEFEGIITYVVRTLERSRNEDRHQDTREQPMTDLFENLSAGKLVKDATALAKSGAEASAVVPLIREFDRSLSKERETIKRRFVYYSQLATVGSIAQMLVHEIRNQTTIIGRLFRFIRKESGFTQSQQSERFLGRAGKAVDTLERLADKFSPLANRNFQRGRRQSVVEDVIRDCLEMQIRELNTKGIKTSVPASETVVDVDPAELHSIIVNLITNATYWLGTVPKDERRLKFDLESKEDGRRVNIWLHDSGPGIEEEDLERVFWPGVTRRPDGSGMGLTLASELVGAHGGQMRTMHPGELGGASFAFDVPQAELRRETPS